jgi:opacity protein-like surface antigen
MKKFFMTLALALGILSVDAQSKDYVDYERGYRADIAVSTSISEQYTLSTSHGFSFGNGLYVGGGVGFTAETFLNFEDAPHYLVPLFADVKYTFLNKRVSPFVSARVGGVFNTEYKMNRMLINPMVGINVRHFTVGLGYELQHAFKGVIENKASMHNVHLRVGYTF